MKYERMGVGNNTVSNTGNRSVKHIRNQECIEVGMSKTELWLGAIVGILLLIFMIILGIGLLEGK